MRQRLKCYYDEWVIPKLRNAFQYKNLHQIPRIEKIIVNRGLGEIAQSNKILESSLTELTTITTQRRVVTRSRKAIAGFKLRKKIPIGLRVTLRGDRIYAFLDRLINLALPRIRDFQGMNPTRFDSRGNYNLGLEEQLMFPEIQYDQIDYLCGINFSIVTTARTDKERFVLLKELGIPFRKKNQH